MNDDTQNTPPVANPQVFQTQSKEINELAGALSLAQGDMHPAKKTGDNTFFKSTYADLNSVIEATRFPLSANDLSMIQYCDDGYVVTQLMHSSGQWLRGRLRITPKDNSPQAIGSALSYARRYSWQMMVGLASADDDAEAAMGRGDDLGYGSAYDPAHAKPPARKKAAPKKRAPARKKTTSKKQEEPKTETTVVKEEEPKTETVVEHPTDEAIPDQAQQANEIVSAITHGKAYLEFHDVDPKDVPESVQKRIVEKGVEGFGEMVSEWLSQQENEAEAVKEDAA